MEINDEDSLKKENITIESSQKEFIDYSMKVSNLKKNIENEINEINKIYEIIYKEVSLYYEKKHEKLILEEKNMKEKLDNEVTSIKEKLENNLSQCYNIIKNNERIQKGMKNLEKENKNILQKFTYITKIMKNNKETNALLQELMKNLKLTFNEEKCCIKYDEYYFNGIQIPKSIEFKDISSDSFKLFWKIDNLNIINIDNNKIKFKVQIKKENMKDKYIQVYEGNNLNCLVDNLEQNTEYEIRICSIYDYMQGKWSSIQKIKIENINYNCDSIILEESNNKKEFVKKIYEWSWYKKMELIYRGSRDGSDSKDFHKKCDHKGPTIVLYKNEKGYIFGGYSPISWVGEENGKWYKNDDCFIFTLTNIHGIEPTKFPHIEKKDAILHNIGFGPTFDDIYIYGDFRNNLCTLNFPRSFKDVLGKGKSIFSGNFNNNISEVKIEDIEVFKVSN